MAYFKETGSCVIIAVVILAIAGCVVQARSLCVGSKAPNFTLYDEQGSAHTLTDMKGKKIALLFYPWDASPRCTKQACSIRDGYADLQAAGITVWGVNDDSRASHRSFKEKYHLTFPLLSDTKKKVAKAYGVARWLTDRVTFLINEQGIIIAILKDINVAAHADQIIKAF